MYKNQLQELAQRSCFNLPSYACIREGPDHAPRFKAIVTFNGEAFESPSFCPTLRQAEHAAAEVALSTLSNRGPSHSIGARMLDETGVCKNLLQETAHRGGVSLPVYTTIRSGPGHLPVFTCIVEVGGQKFVGDVAKTKKQAEKNAAMAALAALKSATGSNLQLITTEASALQASGSRRKVKVSHGRDRSAYREAKHFGFRQPGCGNNNGASSSLLPYHPQLPSSMAGHESFMLSREASTLSRPASRPVEKMMPVRVRNLMPSVQEDSRTQLEEHFRDGKEWLQEEVLKAVLQDEEADSYSLGIWGGSSKTWGRQTAPAPTGMLMPVQVIGLPSSSRDFKPQLEEHFRDEEEWLHGETPKPSLRNGEGSSYNQGMWTGSSPNWGCQFATSYSNNIGNMMPVQVRSLPSSSRTNFKAQLEEHLRDEEDWLSGGTRKAVLRNQEASSYTPRMWEASQNWTCQSQAGATAYSNNPFQFHSVASAAPPVTVRQVATVCSAPPRRVDIAPKVRQEETADKELESLESFSQLRL